MLLTIRPILKELKHEMKAETTYGEAKKVPRVVLDAVSED
jgi:hypothetical protein